MAKKFRTAKALATFAANIAGEKISEDVLILNLKKIDSAPAEYFVICSGNTEVHVRAIAEAVEYECKNAGIGKFRTEGWDFCSWVIIDMFDVVIHIMNRSTREFYNLEKLWGDAQFMKLTEDGKTKVVLKKDLNLKKDEPNVIDTDDYFDDDDEDDE